MTRDDIIRMAREAGFDCAPDGRIYVDCFSGACDEELERFAALVAAAEREHIGDQCAEQIKAAIEDEREACAKVCEGGSFLHNDAPDARFGKACAAAIRARGNT